MKKRFIAAICSIILVTALTGCTKGKDANVGQVEKPNIENKSKDDKPSIEDRKLRVYFFNTAELKHYYINKTISVDESDIIGVLTKELQNNSYNKDFLSLTDKVEIKSAKIDETTGVLKVVFSDSYVDHMTLGSNTESGLLTSLIATYGFNLGVDKIAIYFNDEPYIGLGELPKGYFTVEEPKAEIYKP
ncbi:GerMN domain-containing protein [Clostridium malenominatum]|uniref:GerMN domain-containing protein n=1 Tax=Clostridium malenominatum TaxID=1539 RepID=UPI0031D3974A